MYTLSEAKVIGLRELCARKGHEIQHMRQENSRGHLIVDYYNCGVCDVVISFAYPGQAPLENAATCSARMLMDGHAYSCTRHRDHGNPG